MKRFLSILKWEVIRQFKNGIHYASIFVLVLWIFLFGFIKSISLSSLLPMIILSNLTMTTYFFMAGIMLFEKGEGSLAAQVTTPIKDWEYIAAKAISLTALATFENLIITIALTGLQFNYFPVIAGAFTAGIIFCLVGFITVIRYDSINEFLIPSIGYMFLVTLPILSVFFLNHSWIWYLHPVYGTYKLIENGFTNIGPWNTTYGVFIPLITVLVLGYFSLTSFTRFVVRSEGQRRRA